jgi:ribonucleoside-triphosphate reductase (formate)
MSGFLDELTLLGSAVKPDDPFIVPDGLARSIFEDKYARKLNTRYETWEERVRQVVVGNFSLLPVEAFNGDKQQEFVDATRLSVEGVMAYSGRHLQHGDSQQVYKLMDLFSNCATSPFSFLTLWKSLCGKGVSSDYSSHVRPVNWDNMPNFRLVLNGGSDDSGDVSKGAHPDYLGALVEFQGGFESLREAEHKYPSTSEWVRWFRVEDSREGWAQILCALETAAYHEKHKDKLFIFDLSDIRAAGEPIRGHQNRPASGPIPLMRALLKIGTVKGAFMLPWRQAMYVDDYASTCVSIGGVRRNARAAVMYWKDKNIFEFIEIKRGGHLRMANNSILVDKEFWEQRKDPRTHAHRVYQAAMAAAYYDNTGEPGFANVHNMKQNRANLESIDAETYLNLDDSGLKIHERTYDLIDKVLNAIRNGPYICIPNPCFEACLNSMGDDCLVGDVNLGRARTLNDANRAAYLMGGALVRVSSLMPAICQAERIRTNRVGVSAIGIFEFFWNHFRLRFDDLISVYDSMFNNAEPDNRQVTVYQAWRQLAAVSHAAQAGATNEAVGLQVEIPDTMMLLKPGGTVAKVFRMTESANLPSRKYYLRFIQLPKDTVINHETVPNPRVEHFRMRGYPVQDISHKYPGYVVVGFPTCMPYVSMLEDAGFTAITANNVSVEDHYKWLRLLEYFWLGDDANANRGAQVSYTLKYNPRKIGFDEFMKVIADNQPNIRCCTFATCSDDDEVFAETKELIDNYGWVPEYPLSREEYLAYTARIAIAEKELYDEASLNCETGFCAVDESINYG